MKLRFISPTLHGIVDYSAAIALMIMPIILKLGSSSALAFWISIVTGVAVILVSLNTTYRYGIFNTIPFEGHLAIDLTVATSFMVIPFALNFSGLDAYYYWGNAAAVYLAVSLSDTE